VGVQRLVGNDGAQGVRDHDASLPFCDHGGDVLAGLGAGRGITRGQMTCDLGEADGDEQLGDPSVEAEPFRGGCHGMPQRHGQPALDGDIGQVQRLDPAAGQGLGVGVEGVQRPVRIRRCLGCELCGVQDGSVVGDGQV